MTAGTPHDTREPTAIELGLADYAARLETEKAALLAELDTLRAERDDLGRRLNAANRFASEQRGELDTLRAERDAAIQERGEFAIRLLAAEAETVSLREALREIAEGEISEILTLSVNAKRIASTALAAGSRADTP